jgi:hypothetical protein
MAKDHGSSIKNDDIYEALRDKGASKSKAAAIANAEANPEMDPGTKGGKAKPYEDWELDALRDRAGELDITGYWDMTREELIAALRCQ